MFCVVQHPYVAYITILKLFQNECFGYHHFEILQTKNKTMISLLQHVENVSTSCVLVSSCLVFLKTFQNHGLGTISKIMFFLVSSCCVFLNTFKTFVFDNISKSLVLNIFQTHAFACPKYEDVRF